MTESAIQVSASDYNPLDPNVRDNPYPYYAAMRRDSPVHQMIPGAPLFAVTRYADVLQILHAPEAFTSTAFQVLSSGGGPSLGPNSGALAGHRLLLDPMMIAVDPPQHGKLRALINRGFTPRRIAALEPRLREIAAECVDPLLPKGQLELVHDLAIPFPVTVIAELLGVEPERLGQFKAWSDAIVLGLAGAAESYSREEIVTAADEMADYIDAIVERRRAEPRDDLISALAANDGDEALSAGELRSFVVLLLIAGNETTTNLIGNGMRALLEHPDVLARVYHDRKLIPKMVEEVLRYDSPIQGLPRKAVEDTEIAGVPVPKDAFLMVMFGSANRDAAHFPEPDRFDPDRDTRAHLAFGHGIHFCVGSALARLEARIAFESIFERCRDLRLDADSISILPSMLLRGPSQLPISFKPA